MAMCILAIGAMGVMGLYVVSGKITDRAEDQTVGYNVTKRVVESIRSPGFANTPEGRSTTYFDIFGNQVALPPAQGFRVITTVASSSKEVSQTIIRPARDCTRTVGVTVMDIVTGAVVVKSATLLVYGGA